jgi:hypothetical protein
VIALEDCTQLSVCKSSTSASAVIQPRRENEESEIAPEEAPPRQYCSRYQFSGLLSEGTKSTACFSQCSLYSSIPQKSKIQITNRHILAVLEKKEPGYWDKLLKGKGKTPQYIKVDWSKWVDEDEEKGEKVKQGSCCCLARSSHAFTTFVEEASSNSAAVDWMQSQARLNLLKFVCGIIFHVKGVSVTCVLG